MVFCFLDSQVLGRHISTDDFTMNNEESHESGSVQNYLAMGTDEERNSIFKYILNAYQKVAADNNRLREEYAQLGSVVKFLTDSNYQENVKESNKRAMKNIALGFGRK